jgi:hypothetical protein
VRDISPQERESVVDLVVKQTAEDKWILVDLLGRNAGSVDVQRDGKFTVVPAGHAVEAMTGIQLGPYASLNAALSAIETQTRGTCRLDDQVTLPDLEQQETATADVIDMPIREGDA